MANKIIKTFENFSNETFNVFPHDAPEIEHGEPREEENYMFFGDLETIKRCVDELLKMDPVKVDAALKNGHNWAVDHIVSSKDDVEEVFNFLKNEMVERPNEEE